MTHLEYVGTLFLKQHLWFHTNDKLIPHEDEAPGTFKCFLGSLFSSKQQFKTNLLYTILLVKYFETKD